MGGEPSVARVVRELNSRGFDVCGVASAKRHDRSVPAPNRLLNTEGETDQLVVLVGHSRGWWVRCLDALAHDPALLECSDPLDAVTEHMLSAAMGALLTPGQAQAGRWRVRCAHEATPPSMRDLAIQAGLASLGPAGLVAHPQWGPWISFRAAIVTPWAAASLETGAVGPCHGCPGPCGPAMEEALRAAPIPVGATRVPVESWRVYAEARASCPVGAAERYGHDQLEYHYTHDRDVLRRAVAQRRK